LFIAASYTPFLAHSASGGPHKGVLVAIWAIAWIGVIMRLGFPGRLERISIVLCLLLGWSGLFIYDDLFGRLSPTTVCLIVTGGVLYSVGVIFHLWDQLRFQNAIWHAFVIGAATLQYFAIFDAVRGATAAIG